MEARRLAPRGWAGPTSVQIAPVPFCPRTSKSVAGETAGMDLSDLRVAWHASGKDRPAWVREHADDLRDHLPIDNYQDDIPDEGSMYQLRDWLERYRPTVTRHLAPAGDADGDGGGDSNE